MSGINWGDVPTWLAVIVATAGGTVALVQLRQQGNVIKGEVERNKRRDMLLDSQRRELEQRSQVTERQQAEAVQFSWRLSAPLKGMPVDGPQENVHMAVVTNGSARPIRDVVCRIKPRPEQDYDFGAFAVVELVDVAIGSAALMPSLRDPKLGDRVPLIRSGQVYGFMFPFGAKAHSMAWMKARFTDDAKLQWEIDPDLHLEKLSRRDW